MQLLSCNYPLSGYFYRVPDFRKEPGFRKKSARQPTYAMSLASCLRPLHVRKGQGDTIPWTQGPMHWLQTNGSL